MNPGRRILPLPSASNFLGGRLSGVCVFGLLTIMLGTCSFPMLHLILSFWDLSDRIKLRIRYKLHDFLYGSSSCKNKVTYNVL